MATDYAVVPYEQPTAEELYTSSEGRKQKFREIGKAIVADGSFWPRTKRKRTSDLVREEPIYSIQTYRKMYERLDIVSSILERTAELVSETIADVKAPYHLRINPNFSTNPQLDDNINTARQWMRYIGFRSKVYEMMNVALWAGNSYSEIVYDPKSEWKVLDLKPIEPEEMRVIRSETGDLLGYMQFPYKTNRLTVLNVDYAARWQERGGVEFSPHQILHIKWNPFPSAAYGTSALENLKDVLAIIIGIREDIAMIIKNFAAPLILFRLGTELIPASPESMEEFRGDIVQQFNQSTNLITSTLVNAEILGTGQKVMNVEPYLDQMLSLLYGSMGIPQIMLGQGNDTTEATAKMQMEAASKKIRRIQWYLKDQIELKILPLVLGYTPDPKNNFQIKLTPNDMDLIPEIFFNPIETEEDKRIRLENGFRFGAITREEYRVSYGYPPEAEGTIHPTADPDFIMQQLKLEAENQMQIAKQRGQQAVSGPASQRSADRSKKGGKATGRKSDRSA
jgi:hypothetical protein